MTGASYPHLTHFIQSLVASTPVQHISPPNHLVQPQPQHPLSLSSSGESDSSNSNENSDNDEPKSKPTNGTPSKRAPPAFTASQRDDLVNQIVDLLDQEKEEHVKDVLAPFLGDLAKVR